MQSTENWRPIPGYEGYYEISDLGRVRSLTRPVRYGNSGETRMRKGRVRKAHVAKHGYVMVVLSRDGVMRTHLLHRLVLLAFVGPCPEGMEACHWDDDPMNNQLSNLRWATASENRLDQIRNGGNRLAARSACKRGHEFTGANLIPHLARVGKRGCVACLRELRAAKRRGEDFDPARADSTYKRLIGADR